MSGFLMSAEVNPLEDAVARELFSFSLWHHRISFSNHMLVMIFTTVFLLVFLPLAVRRKRGFVPSGLGNLIETICIFLRDEMARPFLRASTDRYIGFIWTTFFFILTMNLIGMVPVGKAIELVTGRPSHIGGAPTGNIWVVAALAGVVFLAIHISGIRQQGLLIYMRNFAPRVPWPMMPLMYLLEILGAMVRPFSLAIRLFANIFAGHVLIATLLMFAVIFRNVFVTSASVVATVGASLLELLVVFIQAYIFTFLTAIFIGFAVNPEH